MVALGEGTVPYKRDTPVVLLSRAPPIPRANIGGGLISVSGGLALSLSLSRLPQHSLWRTCSRITQLKAQGPSRTCKESKEEEGLSRGGGREEAGGTFCHIRIQFSLYVSYTNPILIIYVIYESISRYICHIRIQFSLLYTYM